MRSIAIEPTSACTLNCVFCGKHARRDIGTMPLRDFETAVARCVEHGIEHVQMTPLTGDVFCDPGIVEKLALIDSSGLAYGFYTNLVEAKQADLEAIANLKNLTRIDVSVNGLHLDEFVALTRGTAVDHGKLVANVELLRGLDIPVRYVIKTRAKEKTDLSSAITRAIVTNRRAESIRVQALDDFAGLSSMTESTRLRNHRKVARCGVPYVKSIIRWDLRFGVCGCRDVHGTTVVGSVRDHSLTELCAVKPDMSICDACLGVDF